MIRSIWFNQRFSIDEWSATLLVPLGQLDVIRLWKKSYIVRAAQMEKMPRWKWIMFVIGAIFATMFVTDELRYANFGIVVKAKISSAEKEFAGFSQRQDGSSPMFRNQLSYQFETGDKTYSGSTTNGGWRERPGQFLTIQYLDGLPQYHRILNTKSNVFRFIMLAGLLWFLTWALLVLRSRFRITTSNPQQQTGIGGNK